jgi:hypothetical protein
VTPTDRRLLSRTWRRCAVLLAVVLLAACAPPPVQRPREGAPPIAGGTPVRLETAPPPTLSAFAAPPTPTTNPLIEPIGSPGPGARSSPGPSGSPGLAPIISGLQPAPGASLPVGDVVISARVSGSTDLVDVTAFLDGESVEVEPLAPGVRVKTVSFVRSLAGGSHEVRIQARDDRDQLGGYRWQFSVGAGRQPAGPTSAPKPAAPTATSAVQPRTPIAVPTRRPTVALPGQAAPVPAAKPSPAPR